MSYNTDHLRTAGKVTVYTTFFGVIIFAIVFIFNIGEQSVKHAGAASNATTSVTVLNTAPLWTASTTEVVESSTNNPTDAGSVVRWTAVGTDSNAENYWLLICNTNATPTPTSGGAPTCTSGVQWAVSGTTTSGVAATVATTTAASWAESNPWFGWICDGNSVSPRCNGTSTQGTNATNSSPFEVNHRPTFTVFTDNSPAIPGATVIFTSTSSDTDTSGTADTVKLIVCGSAGFSTSTDTCTGTLLASSTAFVPANASSTYTIVIPTQDTNYSAFGYVIDNHGFEASGGSQGTDSTLTVSNVAPTISSSTISLAQSTTSTNLILTVASGQTTGFNLSYTVSDNNSCDAVGGNSYDEIATSSLSIYRSGISAASCLSTTTLNANNCYTSGTPTTTWNLSCTASSTSCTFGVDGTDVDTLWNCTFPLWYVADPTDGTATTTQYSTNNWVAQVRPIDNNALAGIYSQSSSGVEVQSFLAFALNTLAIPYGSLEPGQQTDPIVATTTLSATGNVGLDQDVTGQSMCTTYTGSTLCPNSSTSTIPASEQVVATSTVTYAQAIAISSTTPLEVEINVPKSTATSSQANANAFWGIRVPGTVTYAGSYTGENTITAKVGESIAW